MTVDELLDQYHEALREQAAALAGLSGAEETLDVTMAEILATADVAEWKAKAAAKASSVYKAALFDVVEARERAEKAKAEVEYLRCRFEAWRTKSSTARARMQASG